MARKWQSLDLNQHQSDSKPWSPGGFFAVTSELCVPGTTGPSNEDPARRMWESTPGLAPQPHSPVPPTTYRSLLPVPVGTQPGQLETEPLPPRDLLLTLLTSSRVKNVTLLRLCLLRGWLGRGPWGWG